MVTPPNFVMVGEPMDVRKKNWRK